MKLPKKLERLYRKFNDIMQAVDSKNFAMLAAGIAYFAILSFFPMMVTVVAVVSLVSTPESITGFVNQAGRYMPSEVTQLLANQLSRQSTFIGGNIIAVVVGLSLAFIGAAGAIENLIRGLNVAYNVKETRNIVKLKIRSIILTIAGIVWVFVTAALLIINPTLFTVVGIPEGAVDWLLYVRWPIVVAMVMSALTVLYHTAPNRRPQHWRWFSIGTIFATIAWLIVTIGFFIYVQYFAQFSQSYGIFASLIILMMWFNFSAFIILIGAEINERFDQ